MGHALLLWSRANWLFFLLLAIAALAAWQARIGLGDCLLTLHWRLFPVNSPRRQVLRTWRLLDRRLRLYGLARPAGVSPRNWLTALGSTHQTDAAVWELTQCGEWAAFCPESVSSPEQEPRDHQVICTAAVREFSSRRLRELGVQIGSKKVKSSPSPAWEIL